RLYVLVEECLAQRWASVAFSPWVVLTGSGGSITTMAGRDVMLPAERFAEIVGIYLRSADRRDPRASPVFGRFRGAPPVLILSSLHENLRSEEHTSELQSRENLVCRLLLEKKKKKK